MALKDELRANIREIVFGLEDSLVSTLGAVTGIAAGTGNAYVVILSGIVLIFVEAVSMSAGSYLSSKSAKEAIEIQNAEYQSKFLQSQLSNGEDVLHFLQKKGCDNQELRQVTDLLQKERKEWEKALQTCSVHGGPTASEAPIRAAIVMGIFYLTGGLFPLAPYLLLSVSEAILPSIILTAVVLFLLGYFKGKIVHSDAVKSALEMMAVSLTAALLGFIIGRAVSLYFGIEMV